MDNNKNQLVAIYCRVSSEKQEKEGTIESQIAELEKAIIVNGDVIVQRYIDDGYSGELLERPALDQLRSDAIKKLFSKVYILSPDRLARKHHYGAIILEDLKKKGVGVVFVNHPLGESMEDQLLFNVQSIFADYEKARMLDRMRRGKIYKIEQGNTISNAPYGYKYVRNEKTRHGAYEIIEEEAEIVRFIFKYYLSDECAGIGSLRRELFNKNIKSRGGTNKWAQSMAARILSNETYTGTTYWGKFRSIEGESNGKYRRLKNTKRIKKAKEEWLSIPVPPIISESLFRQAEMKRARNKALSPETVKYQYLLRGILEHSCGSPMYSKRCHGHKYYVCGARKNAFPEEPRCTLSRHYNGLDLEEAVWGEFRKTILSPAMLLRRINQKLGKKGTLKQDVEGQIQQINLSLSKSDEKRNRLLNAYSDGAITLARLRNENRRIAM